MNLDEQVAKLAGVGERRKKALEESFGIKTYRDLLSHYPFRYIDRSRISTLSSLLGCLGEEVQVSGTLEDLRLLNRGRMLRGRLADETGVIDLMWFQGVRYIHSQCRVGQRYVLFGRAQLRGSRLNMVHPEIQLTEKVFAPIQPVYHSTEALSTLGLHSKGLSRLVGQVLEEAPAIQETLPEYVVEAHRLMAKDKAIIGIHFPTSLAEAEEARHRLCFEELFIQQLYMLYRLGERRKSSGRVLSLKTGADSLLETFKQVHLPFQLTSSQVCVFEELCKEMCSGYVMNRLLQGEVGSGKTIVVWLCILLALDNDTQAAFMAPTEVLAMQHYTNLARYGEKLGIEVRLLTGSTPRNERIGLLGGLKAGRIHLLIGTHALIEDDVCFQRLGLVVIDEQHRFGVAQRARLQEKQVGDSPAPHLLVMTATPIPRTLALTYYGQLEMSCIEGLPAGRSPIRTAWRKEGAREKVYAFMQEQLKEGHRIYVVYPLVEDSQVLDLASLEAGYGRLKEFFSNAEVEKLHGRMPSREKQYRMSRFMKGEAQILVSTTVIEVGVDVPEATVMLIEHADRFGLTPLHQLRGRVGRGVAQAYCILMTPAEVSKEAAIRLRALEKSTDGFELAELDLRQRGPGDLLGIDQSGLVPLRLAELVRDASLVSKARQTARKLLKEDPTLQHAMHVPLLQQVAHIDTHKSGWLSI